MKTKFLVKNNQFIPVISYNEYVTKSPMEFDSTMIQNFVTYCDLQDKSFTEYFLSVNKSDYNEDKLWVRTKQFTEPVKYVDVDDTILTLIDDPELSVFYVKCKLVNYIFLYEI